MAEPKIFDRVRDTTTTTGTGTFTSTVDAAVTCLTQIKTQADGGMTNAQRDAAIGDLAVGLRRVARGPRREQTSSPYSSGPEEELNLWGKVFDTLDPVAQKDLRNAAFHLLWFGRELCLDREPLTNDKLKK